MDDTSELLQCVLGVGKGVGGVGSTMFAVHFKELRRDGGMKTEEMQTKKE